MNEVLSTVPRSLGDIDHEDNISERFSGAQKCTGIEGCFLLWPRVIKATHSATSQQKAVANGVFERIREYTGIKSAMSELSSI